MPASLRPWVLARYDVRGYKNGSRAGVPATASTGSGAPLAPQKRRRRRAWPDGLRIRFHDLRHTAATLLLREGVHPKVVQETLGHERIGATMDVYSHTVPSMHREAAERVGKVLSGDG